jgi:predicted DNA-binding transcriptional regulator AlpA
MSNFTPKEVMAARAAEVSMYRRGILMVHAREVMGKIEPTVYGPQQLADLLGISQLTLRQMRQRHEIPEPIRIGARKLAWSREVIERWLAEASAAANAATNKPD